MKYSIEHDDKIVIFRVKNDALNSKISAKFKAELLILCQPDIDGMIINLTPVSNMDSSGLGGLLLAHRQLKEHHIPIALVGVNDFIKSIMEISQIDSFFELYDTEEEALEMLRGPDFNFEDDEEDDDL